MGTAAKQIREKMRVEGRWAVGLARQQSLKRVDAVGREKKKPHWFQNQDDLGSSPS